MNFKKIFYRNEKKRFRNARLWSNKILSELGPKFTGDIINVSGWRDSDKNNKFYGPDYFVNASTYSISNWYTKSHGYEGVSSNYLINLEEELREEKLINNWDVVFNHTVLEHIFNVNNAIKSLCKMSRNYIIVVVPFLQEDHTDYGDYWRFTPRCLKKNFEKNNFQLVYISANDNRHDSIYIVAVAENIDRSINYPKIDFSNMKTNFVKDLESIRLGCKFFK